MHFSGKVDIKAPREKVCALVIDPQKVGQCGPGWPGVYALRKR